MNNKVFNVSLPELVEILQAKLREGYEYADFEIEMTDDLEGYGTKLVIYPVSYEGKRLPDSSSSIDPSKDPDDLINDLT
jgi:hypothetical protein